MRWLFVQMKLGYVSRAHPKDNFNHMMLTIQGYKPKEFAGQINLNVNNMWGILKVCLLTESKQKQFVAHFAATTVFVFLCCFYAALITVKSIKEMSLRFI